MPSHHFGCPDGAILGLRPEVLVALGLILGASYGHFEVQSHAMLFDDFGLSVSPSGILKNSYAFIGILKNS